MTAETLTIAKLATDPTAGWHTENTQETATDSTFGAVTFTARTMVALVRASVACRVGYGLRSVSRQ